MKRRDFLAISGAGVAAAVAPDIAYKAWWTVYDSKGYWNDWLEVNRWEPESFESTVCQQCPGACGILVRKVGERAVKIEGNPANPISQGGVCPKGSTALQAHYHPERISSPLRRVGERGSGQWEKISWGEAISEVASELQKIRQSGPEGLAIIDGEDSIGLMQNLLKRFATAYGSPNYIQKTSSQSDELLMKGTDLTSEGFYDISKSKFIISFGMNFLEAFYSPLQAITAYSKVRESKSNTIIYVGSRRSVTGIKSNEWVSVKPGTEGLLALGIARVMIEEGLYNKNFVNSKTKGFSGFESAVNSHSMLDISHETGVDIETIEELARDFASKGDEAVAVGNAGPLVDQVAINNLNLLTGSIGNLWWARNDEVIPFTTLPDPELDSTAENGLSKDSVVDDFQTAKGVFGTLPKNLASRRPYSIKALLIYYSNPLLSMPNPKKVKEALERVPYIVNFSPFLDETAQMSDIILPDNSLLEKWQDAPQFLIDGSPAVGVRKPVVEKKHDTMQTGDVIIEIAKKLGATVASALSWASFEDYFKEGINGIFESGKGKLAAGGSAGSLDAWIKSVSNSAWVGERAAVEDDFDFNSDLASRVTAGSQISEGEFHLHLYKLMTLTKPRNIASPTLFDLAAPHIYRKWVAWVEINPEVAHEMGIHNEDWVLVESEHGRERFKAKITEHATHETVSIPLIIGAKGLGKWEKTIWPEQNPFSLVEETLDSFNGHYIYDTKVRISKA